MELFNNPQENKAKAWKGEVVTCCYYTIGHFHEAFVTTVNKVWAELQGEVVQQMSQIIFGKLLYMAYSRHYHFRLTCQLISERA